MSPPDAQDAEFMRAALALAERARNKDEVPIGAVVVHEGRIIGEGFNLRESLQDPTAHAEMIALRVAAVRRRTWRLTGCTLYVTLEPCAMCTGAIVLARVDRLVYGAADPKAGACGSVLSVVADPRLNHRVAVTPGVLAQPCGRILSEFFQSQRAMGKK